MYAKGPAWLHGLSEPGRSNVPFSGTLGVGGGHATSWRHSAVSQWLLDRGSTWGGTVLVCLPRRLFQSPATACQFCPSPRPHLPVSTTGTAVAGARLRGHACGLNELIFTEPVYSAGNHSLCLMKTKRRGESRRVILSSRHPGAETTEGHLDQSFWNWRSQQNLPGGGGRGEAQVPGPPPGVPDSGARGAPENRLSSRWRAAAVPEAGGLVRSLFLTGPAARWMWAVHLPLRAPVCPQAGAEPSC